MLTVLAFSLVFTSFALLRANPTGKQILLIGAFLLAAGLPCLVQLQFTRVAFFAGMAGLLLLAVIAQGQLSLRWAWPAGIFLLVAGMIRWEGYILAGVVLAPVQAVALWQRWNSRRGWVLGFVLAGSLLAGFGLKQYNLWYYNRSAGWSDYYEYQGLVAQFHDYLRVGYNEKTRATLDAVGWSQVELDMLNQFNYADPERFSAAKLRAVLLDAGPDARVTAWRSWGRLGGDLLLDVSALPLIAAIAAGLVLMNGGWGARAVPLTSLGTLIALALVFFWYMHLPARVYVPALGGVLAVVILCTRGDLSAEEFRFHTLAGAGRGLVVLAAVTLILSGGYQLASLSEGARQRAGLARDMMTRLKPRPDQLFVLWADAFPYQDVVGPLEPMAVPRNFKAVGLIWVTHTPLTTGRLGAFGISDLYRALYRGDNLFLLSNPVGNRILAAYVARHYGVRLGARTHFTHSLLAPTQFYSLSTRPPGSPTRRK